MDLSWLPKVDKLLLLLEQENNTKLCQPLATAAAREAVAQMREQTANGQLKLADKEQAFNFGLELTRQLYQRKNNPSLRRVLNATGIVLHTNLGRAVLPQAALQAIVEAAEGYCNLELDLATNQRSSRYDHVVELLCLLTGAEDALVVNNNAAAVLLALDTLAKGGEAITSRGELVEIGGSFRVPDIMAKTGVTLREVGCTNKTHLRDYQQAITENTKLLLKVHPSNFAQVGFVSEVELAELAELGQTHNIPTLYDLGSGCLYPLAEQGVGAEPLVGHALKSGVDVLCFSGDKLLGGPQAGIIIGKAKYIQQMKANHLTRALRIDKFTLAALEATLRLYLEPEQARQQVPVLEMILAESEVLRSKAEKVADLLDKSGLCTVELVDGVSQVGGGSLPGLELPTNLVIVQPKQGSAAMLLQKLRQGRPAVLAYIRDDKAVFDVRTLTEQEAVEVAGLVVESLNGS